MRVTQACNDLLNRLRQIPAHEQLRVVSNRQPYVHRRSKDGQVAEKPAAGLVTALESCEAGGLPVLDAALAGARLRFRPILMTSLAFIFGALPLMFASGAGANSRHSLGTGVVSGMTIATALGGFFIPVLYVIVAGTGKSRGRTVAAPEPTEPPIAPPTPASPGPALSTADPTPASSTAVPERRSSASPPVRSVARLDGGPGE